MNTQPLVGRNVGGDVGRSSVAGPKNRILASILGLMIWTSPAMAAELVTEPREVSGFTGVDYGGPGNLRITQGDSEGLVIEAEQKVLDLLEIEVDDGVLEIGFQRGLRTFKPIRMQLSVIELESLSLRGSADVEMREWVGDSVRVSIRGSSDVTLGDVSVEALKVSISGSGNLDVAELTADSLRSTIAGSGDVTAGGVVDTQSVSISGSGGHDSVALKSRDASVEVTGSGRAKVWVTEALEVDITGSGSVRYKGDAHVDTWIAGSGRVRQID